MKRARSLLSSVFIAIAIVASIAAPAQGQSNRLTGKVKDAQGDALPGVRITVSSEGTGQRTATTDAGGMFELRGLAPGTNTLRAARDGFSTVSLQVELGATTDRDVCLTLNLARVVDELIVAAEAPIVDTPKKAVVATAAQAAPAEPLTRSFVTGLETDEKLIGIDTLPEGRSERIFGVGTSGTVYEVDPETNEASPAGTVPVPGDGRIGFAFSPFDGMFLVAYGTTAFTFDPATGAAGQRESFRYTTGDPNTGRTPDIVAVGFEVPPPTSLFSELFLVDANQNSLAREITPGSGLIETVGGLGVFFENASMDVARDGAGIVALDVPGLGQSRLFSLDTVTGKASEIAGFEASVDGIAYFSSGLGSGADAFTCAVKPIRATRPVDGMQEVDVTIRFNGEPMSGVDVAFLVEGGANQASDSGSTDRNGRATFTYRGSGRPSVDTYTVIPLAVGAPRCAGRIVWTDEPVVEAATIKANLKSILVSGFNFGKWDIRAFLNGVEVQIKVKNDAKIKVKKTQDLVTDCGEEGVNRIVLQYRPKGGASPVADTEAFATCP